VVVLSTDMTIVLACLLIDVQELIKSCSENASADGRTLVWQHNYTRQTVPMIKYNHDLSLLRQSLLAPIR
jgi:hypothetical protein